MTLWKLRLRSLGCIGFQLRKITRLGTSTLHTVPATNSLHTYELTSGLLKTSSSTEALIGKSATVFAAKNGSKVNSKELIASGSN